MIRYVKGDATAPDGSGPRAIVHVCNNLGAWGAGFVLAISKRWIEPEIAYRRANPTMGAVQIVNVAPGLMIVNMVAQHGFPSLSRRCALDYEALTECLHKVAAFCEAHRASVHMPRIGCGIAGGEWARVEAIILDTLGAIDVTVYDL